MNKSTKTQPHHKVYVTYSMSRLVLTAGVSLLVSVSVFSQLKKFYVIKESNSFDTVDFYLKATATNCLVKQSLEDVDPLSIYGNPDLEKINPTFNSKITNNTCFAKLKLDEYNSSGFGDRFTFAMSRTKENHDFWQVGFSEDKIYRLDLNYGFGNAEVDLTGSPVQKFKLKSGSADILVGYEHGYFNPVLMDTFYVKVDFGSIITRHMEMSRAKNVITKIGFGNVLLDFDSGITEACRVDASVGAGNLEIILPREDAPVIIYVRDSPLCSVKLTRDFEEVENNIFVNSHYSVNATNLLTFDVDVALGQVKFKYVDAD
ncbi:MAG: hypothetical protein AAGA66_08970 [Bacteroidota bacterium]